MIYYLLTLLVVALAGGGGTAYYRWRALRAEGSLALMKSIGAQWRATNETLRLRLGKAEFALKEAQAREEAADAVTAKEASTDARAAAELLRSLSSGSAPAPADVRPGLPSGVPDRNP